MKGFDYLALQGFYDAIDAYGLPPSIIDLDKAAQSHTKVFVWTAYRVTGPIVVDRLTKQGGPLSPLKSTMTTSLGHRYLDDLSLTDDGTLIIRLSKHNEGDPHLPEDAIKTWVTMTKATDDSYIFTTKLPTLISFCLAMEHFQFCVWLANAVAQD